MKQIITYCLLCISAAVLSQPSEAELLGVWTDTTISNNNWVNLRFNDVWGFNINNHEIAVIGSTRGAHFIDVTEPTNPKELKKAFIKGAAFGGGIVHRDYHSFGNHLYSVADEGSSTLQVIDIRNLPDTTIMVYNSDEFIRTSHNIFIDTSTAKLYACGVRADHGFSSLTILSLTNPESPQLLAHVNDINGIQIPYVHDMYVRGDTVYMNGSGEGLWVADFIDPENPKLLGNMQDYPDRGYNHSGWLNREGTHYFMADETHGKALKSVSVADFNDMSVVALFNAEVPHDSITIPHNLIVHCDYLYVSYYYEGLVVYDISDPENPIRIAYYDTYPGPNDDSYRGAWGVYPYLESGNVLISDMQGGLFVFKKIDGDQCGETTSIFEGNLEKKVEVYPTLVLQTINIKSEVSSPITASVFSSKGVLLQQETFTGQVSEIHLSEIPPGFYVLEIKGNGFRQVEKIIKRP